LTTPKKTQKMKNVKKTFSPVTYREILVENAFWKNVTKKIFFGNFV